MRFDGLLPLVKEGTDFKKYTMLLAVLGVISLVVGLIPYIFDYPYCNGCENSGPSNIWELIIMLSYEGWYLQIGLSLLLISSLLLYKQRKKN
ncbi:hypothetical protein [Paenibacillus agri]|uniref:Uncharacterized protein n=1 Tax=Paenibacillus agri TaxID=2744309 RepID=A0A850EM31_9BACL|nr:hypothetical protein [Paenibacillus agri]NUU62128.1 hypothetical protein [Paenibacillus agri]